MRFARASRCRVCMSMSGYVFPSSHTLSPKSSRPVPRASQRDAPPARPGSIFSDMRAPPPPNRVSWSRVRRSVPPSALAHTGAHPSRIHHRVTLPPGHRHMRCGDGCSAPDHIGRMLLPAGQPTHPCVYAHAHARKHNQAHTHAHTHARTHALGKWPSILVSGWHSSLAPPSRHTLRRPLSRESQWRRR